MTEFQIPDEVVEAGAKKIAARVFDAFQDCEYSAEQCDDWVQRSWVGYAEASRAAIRAALSAWVESGRAMRGAGFEGDDGFINAWAPRNPENSEDFPVLIIRTDTP